MKRELLVKELETLRGGEEDSMQELANANILEVYDVLERQGHSGLSFSYVTSMIRRLIFEGGLLRPIMSVEEDPDDWIEYRDGCFQNRRRSSVFFDIDKGYHDIERCAMTDNDGKTWYHRGGTWTRPFEQIKVPYMPDGKKWYIYIEPVIELQPGFGADEGEYVIKKIEYR